jgi:hypothetical protein
MYLPGHPHATFVSKLDFYVKKRMVDFYLRARALKESRIIPLSQHDVNVRVFEEFPGKCWTQEFSSSLVISFHMKNFPLPNMVYLCLILIEPGSPYRDQNSHSFV